MRPLMEKVRAMDLDDLLDTDNQLFAQIPSRMIDVIGTEGVRRNVLGEVATRKMIDLWSDFTPEAWSVCYVDENGTINKLVEPESAEPCRACVSIGINE